MVLWRAYGASVYPLPPPPRAGADAAPGMLSDPVTCVARRLPVSGSTVITKRSGSPSFRVRLAAGLCSRGQPFSEVGVWHPCTSGALGKLVPQATPAGRTHPSISVECTNTSLEPSSGSIKPNPLTGLNQRHVPGASTRSTSSPGAHGCKRTVWQLTYRPPRQEREHSLPASSAFRVVNGNVHALGSRRALRLGVVRQPGVSVSSAAAPL